MWWDWARAVGAGGRLAPARRVYMGPGAGFVDARDRDARRHRGRRSRRRAPPSSTRSTRRSSSRRASPPRRCRAAACCSGSAAAAASRRPQPRCTRTGGPVTDPITIEVIRHGLAAASREMGVTLRKTSCSPIFNEGNDYSCGIFDAERRSSSATASSSPSTSARCRSRSATRSTRSPTRASTPATPCCSTIPTAADRTCRT